MCLWVGLCILWTATFDLATGLSREGYFDYPSHSSSDITYETRNKRAIYGLLGFALKGYETAKKLLKGARHLYTVTTTRKIYVKSGDYGTALRNFGAAKLTEVNDFDLPGGVKGKIGESGDRVVTIQTMGESGYPTMKIVRRLGDGSEEIDIVVYVKTKKKDSPQ